MYIYIYILYIYKCYIYVYMLCLYWLYPCNPHHNFPAKSRGTGRRLQRRQKLRFALGRHSGSLVNTTGCLGYTYVYIIFIYIYIYIYICNCMHLYIQSCITCKKHTQTSTCSKQTHVFFQFTHSQKDHLEHGKANNKPSD